MEAQNQSLPQYHNQIQQQMQNTSVQDIQKTPTSLFQKNPDKAPSHISYNNLEDSILNESSNPFEEGATNFINAASNRNDERIFGLFDELFSLFNLLQNKVQVSSMAFKIPKNSVGRQLRNVMEIIDDILVEMGLKKNKASEEITTRESNYATPGSEILQGLLSQLAPGNNQVEIAITKAKEEMEQRSMERLAMLEGKLLQRIGEENRSLLVKVEEIVEEVEDSIRDDYEMIDDKSKKDNASEESLAKFVKHSMKQEQDPEDYKLEDLSAIMKSKMIKDFPMSKVSLSFIQFGANDNEYLVSRNKPTKQIAFYNDGKKQFCIHTSCKDLIYFKDHFWMFNGDKKQLLRQSKEDQDPVLISEVDTFGYARDFGNILSTILGNIIILRYHRRIHFIEINANLEKGMEKRIRIKEGDEYKCIRVFGKKRDKFIAITNKGRLMLNEVKISGKEIVVNKLDEIKVCKRGDFGYRLAIPEDGNYVFVANGLGTDFDNNCSSIIAVKITRERRLEQVAMLDIAALKDFNFACFEVYGVYRDMVVLCGGLGYCSSKLRTFVYDKVKKEFKYMTNLVRFIGQEKCYKLVESHSGKLFGITNESGIMGLEYHF